MSNNQTSTSGRGAARRSRIQRLKNEFLSLAAHEIRTPITVIKAQAQLAERFHGLGKLEGEILERSLRVFVSESDRLARLCSDLLDVARIDNDSLSLRVGLFDLLKLVREVLNRTSRDDTKLDHKFVLSTTLADSEDLIVVADRERTERIFYNLLSNAMRCSPNGGTIHITVARADGEAVVSVRDEGLGISAEEITRIFDRYYQARDESVDTLSGLGIGLYLCREIIGRMSGRISARSEGPGTGSEFTFALKLDNSREDTSNA